jgi:Carboxypeptidase regulatory-like domain
MGDRARALALVGCLVLLAAILGGIAPGYSHAPVRVSTTNSPAPGTILVKTAIRVGQNSSTLLEPIAGANVSISTATSRLSATEIVRTQSNGEYEDSIAPGQYRVSASDPDFNQTTTVSVQSGMTTEVDVLVTRNSYPALLSDLPDPESTGSVSPWSYVSVSVNASLGLQLNDSLFIDGYYSSYVVSLGTSTTTLTAGGTPGTPITFTFQADAIVSTNPGEVPAVLVSSHLEEAVNSPVLWLTLQPENFFTLSNLYSLAVATYSSNVQVSMYAS